MVMNEPANDGVRRFWRLRPGFGLHAEQTADDRNTWQIVLQQGEDSFPLASSTLPVAQALGALEQGSDEDGLLQIAVAQGADGTSVAHALYLFDMLRRRALINEVIAKGAADFAVRERMTIALSPGSHELPAIPADESVRLSRFAFIARHGGEAVLESPLSAWRIRLSCPDAAAFVSRLMGTPVPMGSIADPAAQQLASWLVACSFAGPVDDDGLLPEDTDPDLRFWDFHDLLHARRSRVGGHDHPVGASFPGKGVVAPLPAVKPAMASRDEDIISLPRIDVAAACQGDPPHQAVVEARRSVRSYGSTPMDRDALGAFLFRSARMIARVPPDPENELFYEASRRPWPCGGAAYETEIYVTVNHCAGLERAIYHYDPEHHRLERISRDDRLIEALVTTAWHSAAQTVRPQVLLTLTARMRRLSWKYRGMAWAVALKHAGVLYHAFYLAATVTGLAPCGLGLGNSELVRRVTGAPPAAEMPIGEFMLGSLPERP